MKNLFTMVALFLAVTAVAQEKENSNVETGINLGYDFTVGEDYDHSMFRIMPECGKYFSENFYCALGAGVSFGENSTFTIPVFLRSEVDFATGKIKPYVSMLVGYDISTESDGFFRINPSVGVKVPVSNKAQFNLGFGYTRTVFDGGGANYLGFNLGVACDANVVGETVMGFFNMFDYSVELEYTVAGDAKNSNYTTKYDGVFGVKLAMMKDLPVENLSVGICPAFGRYEEMYKSEFGISSTCTDFYLKLMGRLQYRAKQFEFVDGVCPFAYLDLGLSSATNGDDVVIYEPTVGANIAITEKHAIDVAVGYTKFFDEGALRLAVGYNF